jgi:hypothetical protein
VADRQVRYRFIASDQGAVVSAFKGITASAREAQKSQVSGAKAAERASASAARSGANAEARRWKEAEQASSKIQREFAKEAKAAERAAQAKIRSADKAAQAQIKAAEKAASAAERAANKRAAAEQRANAALWKDRAEKFGKARGIGADAIMTGAAGLGAVATGAVGLAARDAMRLQETANRISINSRAAGQEFADPTKLRKEFEATAMAAPGIKSADVADAVQAFVTKTGNLDVARQNQGTFATIASASGADIKDVSAAAADLFEKFDIKTMDDMGAALAALNFQGKQGSFELKDAAGQFAKLSAAASRFGLDKGVTGVKTLGGLTQIARSATGSSEQAANAVEASMRQLVSKSSDIKSDFGVDVFTDKSNTKTNDIRQVIGKTIAGAGGDLTKLQKVFGEEGIRGISPLISTFNQARNKSTAKDDAGKTADGLRALNEQLTKAIDAPGDMAEAQRDAAQAQKNTSAQLTAAWEQLQAAVGAQLLPSIITMTTAFADVATKTDLIDMLVGTFGVLAEAAELAVGALMALGLVSPKEVTKVEKLDKAKKDRDAFEKELQGKGLSATKGDLAKRDQLAGAVAAAEAEAYTTTGTKRLTQDQFAEQYAGLNKGREGEGARAASLAATLTKDPMDFMGSNDLLQQFGGETTEQRDLRRDYQGQVTQEQKQPEIKTDEAQKSVEALSAASARAARAINDAAAAAEAAKQPSIFSPT